MGNGTSAKKRGLGRGLGALIVNTDPAARTDPVGASAAVGIQQIALHQIQPNPRQPRTHFDAETLAELAASIRAHGIIQPLIVTQQPDQPGVYFLVAGERRWRAAQLAELTTVPVLVREASPSQLIEWALIENVQRADLNPLEEAAAYQALIDEFGFTQDEVAKRVGKSRPAVANAIRLLKLPLAVQEALTASVISAGHARAVLALEDSAIIERAVAEVIRRGLNVRQTEELVKQWQAATVAAPPVAETPLHPQIAALENRFRTVLGTRVNLTRNPNGSGRLVIHFFNDEDLEHLYQVIAGHDEAGG
jgi:ParB family transcriptional regulator, chromosome partitioning protein